MVSHEKQGQHIYRFLLANNPIAMCFAMRYAPGSSKQ
jgi:hypothetical protein